MIVRNEESSKPCQTGSWRIFTIQPAARNGHALLRHFVVVLCIVVSLLGSTACSRKKTKATVPVSTRPPVASKLGVTEVGIASWYGHPYHGRRTANGEVYDMNKMTAAHPTLAFHTWVLVKNLDNGRSTTVRINDRGPFVDNRAIDLSRAAAREIAMIGPGTAKVRVEVIAEPGQTPPRRRRRAALIPASSPSATKEASPVSQPVPAMPQAPASDTYRFAVQFGAFRNLENAQLLRDRVAGHLADARVVPSADDPSLWLVLAGSGLSRQQADEIIQRLQQEFVRIFPVSGY